MCSRSERGATVVLAALVVAALGLVGCNGGPPDSVAMSQPPAMSRPVGPVPGPATTRQPTTNPFGQDPIPLNQGRLYFGRYNCAGCHGDHGGGGMGPSLRDGDWIYGSSDAQIFGSISEGRAHGMPAWGTRLPEEVVWKLVAYIRSMRTPAEPEPADQTTPAPPEMR
jgi:cytochrome c oxidase cbb3-type subunit 3